MSGKNLLEGRTGPITQSIDAVKSLLAYVGRSSDPLPSDVSLDNGRLVLILSNKKDCYYVVTKTACSCPSAIYRHNGPCKHQRKYFPEQIAKPVAQTDSIRPAARWIGPDGQRVNGPVEAWALLFWAAGPARKRQIELRWRQKGHLCRPIPSMW